MIMFIYYTCACSAIMMTTFGRAPGYNNVQIFFYLALGVQFFIDMYVMKKPMHKFAGRFADKELRQRMKAAKKEKKRMKYERLCSAMGQINQTEMGNHYRTAFNPLERKLWNKQRELAEEIHIYNLWLQQQQTIQVSQQENAGAGQMAYQPPVNG